MSTERRFANHSGFRVAGSTRPWRRCEPKVR